MITNGNDTFAVIYFNFNNRGNDRLNSARATPERVTLTYTIE